MSKKDTNQKTGIPELLDMVTKLELSVEHQAENCSRPGGAEEIEGMLNKLAELAITPDQVKFLNDRFMGSAEAFQKKSDEYGHVAIMLEHCAQTMQDRLITAMRAKKLESVDGDTWRAVLVPAAPQVRIDFKVLSEKAPEYLTTAPTLDEKKFDAAIKAGVEIPGTTVEPQFALSLSVIKRVE